MMADSEQTLLERNYEIITRNLEEVASSDELKSLLSSKSKIKVYWGTAITGKPHMGYFVPILKLSDFLKAGCEVKVLFADVHGFLDNQKSHWEQLKHRCKFYEILIKELLMQVNVPIENLNFVVGSSYQFSPKYTLDVYKASAMTTVEHSMHASSQVVKQVKNPYLSSLMYPLLQALDEEYLDVDIQFGGVDQRKIFMLARELLPKMGYKKRVHLMNPLIPGLGKSGKMSSSEPNSKLDFDDSDDVILKKIMQSYIVDGVVENNGLLAMLKYVVFAIIESQGRKFTVLREEKWGGNCEFLNYEQVEAAFKSGTLVSVDLKKSVAREIILIITPIREFLKNYKSIVDLAYPPPEKQESEEITNTSEATISSFDVRVGQIISVEDHLIDNSLSVIKVNIGDEECRTVVSDACKHAGEIVGNLVLIVCNVSRRSVKGVQNQGHILVTCDSAGGMLQLPQIPLESQIGEKLQFPIKQTPDAQLTSKRFCRVFKCLITDENGNLCYKKGEKKFKFVTSAGICSSAVANGLIK